MSNNDSRSIGLLIQLALLCVLPNFGESQREGLNFMSSGHKHRRLLPDSVGHISAPTRVSGYHCRKCEKKGECLHWPGQLSLPSSVEELSCHHYWQ